MQECPPFDPWLMPSKPADQPVDSCINIEGPLDLIEAAVEDKAPIAGMILSPCGTLLLTFSLLGIIKVWDIENNFRMLVTLNDSADSSIADEFYTGAFPILQDFLPDSPSKSARVVERVNSKTSKKSHVPLTVAVAGKSKDRTRWCDDENDNAILPCDIKIFDLNSGRVISRLAGHQEEVLCLKAVVFKNTPYYISASEDGYIFKWEMQKDWRREKSSTRMKDGANTCMAFSISFLPQTGNKYFVAACDARIAIFDFEAASLLQSFDTHYSCYCDFVAPIVPPAHLPPPPACWADILETATIDILADSEDCDAAEGGDAVREPMFAYVVSRGVEYMNRSDLKPVSNTVFMHRLTYPAAVGGEFRLQDVASFAHPSYQSNSWPTKVATNTRILVAPTNVGDVVIFNLASGRVAGILRDHKEVEVRDALLHPTKPLLFTCSDDGTVKVYRQCSAK
ncbi:hypothetical protein HDU82_004379 [Entophlyctis luteolus]|nr:hypothetical protein HDU82_004379 [Entophlyctis luteolus]